MARRSSRSAPPAAAPPAPGAAAWLLAAVPLLLGAAAEVAALSGTVGDPRLAVSLTALRADWLLAIGVALSAVAAVGVAGVARRRTAVRRAVRAQVRGAARERRLLLSRLDHELKNPLTAMRAAVANASATLPEPAGDADPQQDGGSRAALRSIDEQVLRLSRLTADLRKIADVENNALDARPVDVAALLEEAVEVVGEQPAADGRDIKVDVPRAPWPLPPVLGDADLLSLAVLNLLDNAVKYTPAGGTIEVRARESGGQVVIEVADTGPGIDPEDLPHVWEELYRSPSVRAVPGSGLGLPLVRAVAERHGGAVTAESRLGRGTAVRLRLPVAPAAEA